MVSKKTGARRGRPTLAVKDDPERYWVTNFMAKCSIGLQYGLSDRQLALTMCMARYGELVADPENVSRFVNMTGHPLFHYASGNVRGSESSAHARDTTAFHPRADDLCRKARRWGNLLPGTEDCRWVTMMGSAWIAALAAGSIAEACNISSGLCWSIGETAFCNRVLLPIAESRFGRKPPPRFSVPEFIPQD